MRIADMHCDTISMIHNKQKEGMDYELYSNCCHIDICKLKKSSYILQNFAIFIKLTAVLNPFEACMEMIDCYYQELEKNKEWITPVYSYQDIKENMKNNKISALLTIEEGGVLKGSKAFLRNFYRLGVRMLTLTWNYENELGYPGALKECQHKGLTECGLSIIEEMEHLGMIIDVSHLSDGGFWSVCKHAKKPFVASHSNARSITGHMRNLTDDMIRGLAELGGVAGLNFCAAFLDESVSSFGTIEHLIRHAKHMVKVGGIECLGLGTDFDGIEDENEISNASKMNHLWDAMKKSGFKESELERIFYKNVLRIYQEVLH